MVERLSALSRNQRIFALPPRSLAMTSRYTSFSRSSVSEVLLDKKVSSCACGVLENEVVVPPPVSVVLAMCFLFSARRDFGSVRSDSSRCSRCPFLRRGAILLAAQRRVAPASRGVPRGLAARLGDISWCASRLPLGSEETAIHSTTTFRSTNAVRTHYR